MSTVSSKKLSSPARGLSLPAAFSEQLATLYGRVQSSDHVFASPLGPFVHAARSYNLPRFVYFGPNSSDASLRLAFLAGASHRDPKSTLALLHLVESLAIHPDIGQGLNLSFFPLLDVLGLHGATPDRSLSHESWTLTKVPELHLLEKDARLRNYHGFIRVESTQEEEITVRLVSSGRVDHPTPALELISSEDTEPFTVRWESHSVTQSESGPLTIAEDLPFQPFELSLLLPHGWPSEIYREAAALILKRFIIRHRAFLAYGANL